MTKVATVRMHCWRLCGAAEPNWKHRQASAGRRNCKTCKLLHLWNQSLSLCTVSAAAAVASLTLTPLAAYVYKNIPFISDFCRKAWITVRRRLINQPHVKYFHSAAVKHVAASLVQQINKPGDSPDQWPCVTGKTGRGKTASLKGIEKRRTLKRALCVFICLAFAAFASAVSLASPHPPQNPRRPRDLVLYSPETCYLLMHFLPSCGKKNTQM